MARPAPVAAGTAEMVRLVAAYPDHVAEATKIPLPDLSAVRNKPPKKVAFLGMGGSGIGGEFAVSLLDAKGRVPGRVIHDYSLPGWVDRDTWVIATSYSGGTEETLDAFAEALARGAPCAAIASGGLLLEAAERHKVPFVTVPKGLPPRGAFGFLTLLSLRMLAAGGLVDGPALDKTLRAVHGHAKTLAVASAADAPEPGNLPLRVAKAVHKHIPMVIADTPYAAAAERLRCNLNENAKVLAYTRILPECNHNDTVAWTKDPGANRFAVVWLGPFDRNRSLAARAEFLRELFASRSVPQTDLDVDDEDPLARALACAYVGDWVSVHLATMGGVDAMDVGVIEKLKQACATTGHLADVKKRLGLNGVAPSAKAPSRSRRARAP